MKSCLITLALIGSICAGGAVVYLNPSLVSHAEHLAQQGADWASGELAHATPSPNPSTAGAAVAHPNTDPITLITPPAATVTLPDWTSTDCAWAQHVMAWDYSLDSAEATKIATGQDTRYGTSPALVQYYLTYAADWQAALDQITEVCNGTGAPTPAERATSIGAFTTAIAAHQADAASKAPSNELQSLWDDVEGFFHDGTGWNIKWDNEWIGYYQRLTLMFDELS